MDNLETVCHRLSLDERLAQLAEEASELSQAALKLRRARSDLNPTPVSPNEAYAALLEEAADVLLCLHVVGIPADPMTLKTKMDKKLARWADRIRKVEEENNAD